ncbi:hypothetical protein BDQ94DRAFT_140579 [Aspergillus welwitschiae]|uniref:Uncharacterized protein n=1 Tax=Aspergillus welwitschiae TaxID=1341132 RepID=A0A3F3Q7W7_9EURO|nr:hypothetical protein BDQ94DRAFT_140579 [Aspergillus welwitschiae]RDH35291.1 hypothetical protein BDQ94DRAFT_140579 [Aspergillus welwitschiae]
MKAKLIVAESHCNSSPVYPIPHTSGRNRAERIKVDLAHSRNTSSFRIPTGACMKTFMI